MKIFRTHHALRLIALLLLVSSFAADLPPTPPPPDSPDLADPVFLEQTGRSGELTDCDGLTVSAIQETYEQQVVEMVNLERAAQIPPLPPLKRVSLLEEAARYHASDMYRDYYFDHDSYDRIGGSLHEVCSWSDRVSSFYSHWWWLGENIARGYSSPSSVMAGWMGSDGHRANILDKYFREIGVGYYSGNYWVQDFGSRSGFYPAVINNEAASTQDRTISLYLYGTQWTEMRLRNNDEPWSGWYAFQNTFTWQLPPKKGLHTVTVEMRNANYSTSSSDTIYLDIEGVLGNLPDQLTFLYSIPDDKLTPPGMNLIPLNIGDGSPLHWQVMTQGTWFAVSPLVGDTPAPITVTPTTFNKSKAGFYAGSLTLTVDSPPGVIGSPHTIELSLYVTEEDMDEVYLPLVIKSPP